MRVNNDNLLWLTRGKSWGFRFLSEPLGLSSVESVYRTVFLKNEGCVGYWKGIIFGKWHFLACRCYDNQVLLNDAAGRRIPHEFLILCSPDEQQEFADKQWGPLIVDKTRDYYLQQYDSENNEIQRCIMDFELVATAMPRNDGCEMIDVPFSCIHNNGAGVSKQKRYYRAVVFSVLLLLFAVCVCGAYYCLSKKTQNNCYIQDVPHQTVLNVDQLNDYNSTQEGTIVNRGEITNDSLTDSSVSEVGSTSTLATHTVTTAEETADFDDNMRER